MAAISALEALKRPCRVDLHTDSQYLRNGIMSWIANWKRNGWRTADKKPVKNIDLWQRLEAALGAHQIRWHWVKGHAGHDMNERADELAREAIAEIRARVIRRGGFETRPYGNRLLQRLQQIVGARHLGLAGRSSTLSVFTTPSSTTMA